MDDGDNHEAGGEDAPGRPLGRGLQEVSHLFLSHRTGQPPPASAGVRGGPALLRPTPVTRERLAAMLLECDGGVEDGLRAIDTKVPCPPCGEIDLLAVDRAGRLAIVDFETTVSDALLLRGVGQLDWIVRNLPNVQRMYREHPVTFSLPPRLFLVGPQFSPLLRTVARQLARLQIHWVRYHAVDVAGTPGLLFEPVAVD